jgi:hypothetical protein
LSTWLAEGVNGAAKREAARTGEDHPATFLDLGHGVQAAVVVIVDGVRADQPLLVAEDDGPQLDHRAEVGTGLHGPDADLNGLVI